MNRRLLTLTLLFVAIHGALGSENDTPTIKVRARRLEPAERVVDGDLAASSVSAEDYRSQQLSIADLSAQAVGLSVRRQNGLGGFSFPSLRGSTPSQVSLFLDGMPLSQESGGIANLEDLPLAGIDRIDIYRGTTPTRYLALPIGGVIDLIPDHGAVPFAWGKLTTGSFGLNEAAAGVRAPGGHQIAIDAQQSAGDFPFVSPHGTPKNSMDDFQTRRQNNAHQQVTMFGQFTYAFADTERLTLLIDGFVKQQGMPGTDSFFTETAALHTGRINLQGGWAGRIGEVVQSSWRVSHCRLDSLFVDEQNELGRGFARIDQRLRQTQVQTDFNGSWGERQRWAVAMAISGEQVQIEDELDARAQATPRRYRLAGGVEDELTLAGDRLRLTPRLRVEVIDDHSGGTLPATVSLEQMPADQTERLVAPSLSGRIEIDPTVWVRASVALAERAPTLFERFGDGASTRASPGLQSERAVKWDATGVVHTTSANGHGDWRLELGYFESWIDELIFLESNAFGILIARNSEAATIRGVEAAASFQGPHRFVVNGVATLQSPINRSPRPEFNGRLLPGRPRHDFAVTVRRAISAWADLRVATTFRSSMALDAANLESTGSRVDHDLALFLFPWRSGLTLALEGRNLTNDQSRDVRFSPLPGRSVSLTLSWDAKRSL